MSEQKKYFQFGLTQHFACNYLPEKKERLMVVMNHELLSNENYQRLLEAGFRRSGNQVYRPHCKNCDACESLRVPVQEFAPTRSQKRVLKINQDIEIQISSLEKPTYYPLYKRYINAIHQDGGMYPANREQYNNFIFSKNISQLFIELYLEQKLVSVAVTDNLPNALSALYTFYDPDLPKRSLGILSILSQIKVAQQLQKNFLYLGYQIDDCSKMNYKSRYFPHQRLQGERWQRTNK
ncbi:arginyltransferase [Thalassotalea mangrovi]|uniref:Aspartate/glutamate leucyltransferase n=1 Tax=Thalassotalea mangrovi TaxID=2572245 RepID=A0A4U1B2A1_9GAMM|nr:arginyltransferase [Thalassotalea mangrovi]TKB43746.1 arginyltransferase [Thalassotalea mangrovi]